MSMDDNDGQMIFGDLKLPDICLTGEEKPRKNLAQETCPNRGSNPGPLHDKRACYHLLHSGGLMNLPQREWPGVVQEIVDNVQAAFQNSPQKLVRRDSRELHVLKSTIHKVLPIRSYIFRSINCNLRKLCNQMTFLSMLNLLLLCWTPSKKTVSTSRVWCSLMKPLSLYLSW